jgi:outer membrane protein assembly factor BamB
VAGPLVDRAVDETRRVLDRANLPPGALAGILLVGGSSRIPLVASRLHARFQVAPTVPEQPELPVAYGGLLVVPPGGPISPAAGPTGPVSAAPYAMAPTTGPTPVPGWAPQPPPQWRPPPQTWAPQPPQPEPASFDRSVKSAYRRAYILIGVIILVVLLLAFGSQLFKAGSNLFSGIGGAATPGSGGGGNHSGTGGPLALVAPAVDLAGEGAHAVAAGGNQVFYSVTGGGQTVVRAVDPASGKEKWSQNVKVEPQEESLTVLGDLLILDAKQSASDGGKDMRVVLQAADGHEIRKLDWSGRKDVAFFGGDAVTSSDRPMQSQRLNLRTGQVAWSHPAPKDVIIADHRVNPEFTWNSDGKNVPPKAKGFIESLGVNPNRVVELNDENGTAVVLDGNGKQTASGKVPVDDKLWTVFNGLLIGALTSDASAGKAQLAMYRLDGLKQAFPPVAFNPGDEIKYVHPCNERLVCVTYQKKSDDTNAVVALDVQTGQKVTWQRQPAYGDFADDPYWLLVNGRMIYGEGSFPPHLICRGTGLEVLDATSGQALHTLADVKAGCGDGLSGSDGKYLAMTTYKVNTGTDKVSVQLSLVDVGTGKRTDEIDIGPSEPGPVEEIAVLGTTVAAIGNDRRLRIASASKLV